MNNDNITNKIIKYSFILGLFLVVLGVSYALFSLTLTGKKKTRISTASFKLELLDKNNNNIEKTDNNEYEYEINLDDAVPETDEEGLKKEGFVFKLRNSGTVAARYTIYLDDVELVEGEERILDKYVKYSLTKNETEGTPTLLSTLTERKLDTGIISDGNTLEYKFSIWIDENADLEAANKVFNALLRVEGEYVFETGTMAFELYNNNPKLKLDSFVSNGFDSNKESDGLYEYTDEEGTTTYVYRGINPNNYVSFAGSTWRVLRIQEDGTVKLIKEEALNFVSDRVNSDAGIYKEVKYNTSSKSDDNTKYEGSNVKAYVDEWYASEMINYDDMIVTNPYCSDKTENLNSDYYTVLMMTRGPETEIKLYGVLNKLKFPNWNREVEPTKQQLADANIYPSISCRNDDVVNAKTALITVDEYILAGGRLLGDLTTESCRLEGSDNYLVSNLTNYPGFSYLLTMSPGSFYKFGASSSVAVVYKLSFTSKGVFLINASGGGGALPVVTLKSNISITSGNGTSSSPYIIE